MMMPSGIHELQLSDGPAAASDEVEVGGPESTVTVPTFVGADGNRRVRFRVTAAGNYEIRVPGGAPVATVTIDPAAAASPAPRLRREGRRLITDEGAPFLWLADTWWHALCDRLEPLELEALAAQRVEEGFNVVHVVAGLLPEIYSFDPLGDLAGVWPWTEGYGDLEPRWWDAADRRIAAIVSAGLVPTIVAGWSYYLLDLGRERIERHWREIVARWSALPVVWCVAGEAGLMHYEDIATAGIPGATDLAREWREVAGHLRRIDPYQNLRTVHPCPAFAHYSSTDVFEGDVSDLDLIWLQTGHSDRPDLIPTLNAVARELSADHGLPVINSEVCYEGIAGGSEASIQRFLFWSHVLSGTAGHSYGAQGIWAFYREGDPGPGIRWGDTPWKDAAQLPGGRQSGWSAQLARRIGIETLTPAPQTLTGHADAEHRAHPYAARSADRVVAYFPVASISPSPGKVSLLGLEPGEWEITWWDPRRGREFESRVVTVGPDGEHLLGSSRGGGSVPSMEDWVLIATRRP